MLTATVPPPPIRDWRITLAQWVAIAVFLLILIWAWQGAQMKPLDLILNSGNSLTYARDFWPPNFHEWRFHLAEMAVTVQIAIWGTVLAVVAAVPVGLLAAANITPWWIHLPVRRVLDAFRAINEMVFALLFVVAVGLGPFAGVLALAVHTTGILGKLFSEVVESIDPGQAEGIRATGAHRLAEIAYGVIPQVMPLWIGYT